MPISNTTNTPPTCINPRAAAPPCPSSCVKCIFVELYRMSYVSIITFVEFYDRHLQIGLLTFVHFPPPFRCFHHRSFNICNLPPSCNCRIALLIGVRNGESEIENRF